MLFSGLRRESRPCFGVVEAGEGVSGGTYGQAPWDVDGGAENLESFPSFLFIGQLGYRIVRRTVGRRKWQDLLETLAFLEVCGAAQRA